MNIDNTENEELKPEPQEQEKENTVAELSHTSLVRLDAAEQKRRRRAQRNLKTTRN